MATRLLWWVMTVLPRVIQTESLHPDAARWLGERSQLTCIAPDAPELAAALATARGLVIRTYTKIDEALLAAAPELVVVGRAGVGLDQVDLAACAAHGVTVVHTPDANTQAVVEYVMTILLASTRPLQPLTTALDPAAWRETRSALGGVRQLSERTLGILGFGRIGRRLANAALGLGMSVQFNDLREITDAPEGCASVSAETLFASSDVISIHIDGRAANAQFVGAALLERMRDDVILVNAARGFVLDDIALAAYLQTHVNAHAHLDVHDPEPFPADAPLLHCPNATLYPHQAAKTDAAMEAMSWVVRDVVAVLEGRAPKHPAAVAL